MDIEGMSTMSHPANTSTTATATGFVTTTTTMPPVSTTNGFLAAKPMAAAPRKGAIKKMIRTQKTFLETFNKYRCEVRSLQAVVEGRFKRIHQLEERLINMAQTMQSSSQTYLLKRAQIAQRNRKLISTIATMPNNVFHVSGGGGGGASTGLLDAAALAAGVRTTTTCPVVVHNESLESEQSENGAGGAAVDDYDDEDMDMIDDQGNNLFFEPIINIQEVDGMVASGSKTSTMGFDQFLPTTTATATPQVEANIGSMNYAGEAGNGENITVKLANGQANNNTESVVFKPVAKRNTIPVSSKSEFLELINTHQKNNNLVQEQVSENIFALQTIDSESVIGYKCSVRSCNYSHFLKAQVRSAPNLFQHFFEN